MKCSADAPTSPYAIKLVNAEEFAEDIKRMNALFPDDFLDLKPRHLMADTIWHLVYCEKILVGFAGAVPFHPFEKVGYYKRVGIIAPHRGHGLDARLVEETVLAARLRTPWTKIVSSCHIENLASANSFINAGWKLFEPERPWEPESLFWIKTL